MEKKRGDSFVEKWHSIYFFMPVFENPPKMPSLEAFLSALSGKFGKVLPLSDTAQMPSAPSDMLTVVLWDYLAYYEKEQKRLPTELVLYGPDKFNQELWDDGIIAQFWECGRERRAFASRCRYSVMASNFLAAMLPIQEQYQILADYADVLLELFPDCIGIYWPHSQKLTPREVFCQSGFRSPELHFLDGGLHVRFFRINGTDEMLFDTLGLTPIGLPDLQCHCKNLNPDDVVSFLRNLAAYLYENGDVIEDHHTVEGIDHEKWPCRHEDAMAMPMRVVLDICPGKYAGGGRAEE